MSSLLVLQDRNNIIMASDTASSVRINNIPHRVSDNEQKIFDLNGYKVFASGQMHIRDLFINMARSEINNFTPIVAEEILKKYFLEIDEYCLEVIIAEKLNDSTALYFLSSYNGFNLEKNISSTIEINAFSAGIQTKDIMDSFEREFIQTHKLLESIIKSYNSNQTEEVGGSVEIHQVGINSPTLVHKLTNIDVRRTQSTSKEHLIIGDRIIGKILIGTRLLIEDENGIIRMQGSLQEIFNKEGVMKVALGEYEPNKFGLKINQGAIQIVGGLEEDQLSQPVKDKLAEADGIRADLRLTAPLPTNLSLDGNGITATVTGNSSRFVRMDYRGLYVQNGAIDIRTGASSNRGVLFDGDGIRAYNSSGAKTLDFNTNGDFMFGGRLEGATGVFSGNLSAVGGTFSGELRAASGTFSGSLVAADGTFSGILSGASGTFSGTVKAADIESTTIRTSNFLTQYGNSTISIGSGKISATGSYSTTVIENGTVSVSNQSTSARLSEGSLSIGDYSSTLFANKNILASYVYGSVSNYATLDIKGLTRLYGTLSFSNLTSIDWGGHTPTAVWG